MSLGGAGAWIDHFGRLIEQPANAQPPGERTAIERMGKTKDELLDILECPVGHAPLVQHEDWLYSTDPDTRRKYPIRDGIPIMLIDESSVAEPDEFKRVMDLSKSTDSAG